MFMLRLNSSILLLVGCVVILIMFAADRAYAQDDTLKYSHNAIYVEGLGPGVLYSFNYDYRITMHTGVRVGFTSWSFTGLITDGKTTFTDFPIEIYALTGKKAAHLEVGLGIVPAFLTHRGADDFVGSIYSKSSTVVGTATVGFRAQPIDGVLFRLAFTPLFDEDNFLFYGGISLGYAF